jgi:hypothetical protein
MPHGLTEQQVPVAGKGGSQQAFNTSVLGSSGKSVHKPAQSAQTNAGRHASAR